MTEHSDQALKSELARIQSIVSSGQVLQAEMACLKLLDRVPDCVPAMTIVAQCALGREDHARALAYFRQARVARPDDEGLLFREANLLASLGELMGANEAFSEHWRNHGRLVAENWLLWGHVMHRIDQPERALKAWFRAIDKAQGQGLWINESTTPQHLLPMVLNAMQRLAAGRRELLFAALEPVRREFGDAALARVDRAVLNYLGATRDGPRDTRQRPKFLYIPGLPDTPYIDPGLQPWAGRLEAAFEVIRDEAASLLSNRGQFESFLTFGPNSKVSDYLGGDGEQPAWDAFFFYRHGRRYDTNHARCPQTSAVLDSLDLCRIKGQAPEVCFSLLAPGSHIMPHHGVTNSRLVMHLPLKVPAECALNVIGAQPHHWQEGRLMMFDDTFEHEAWNRSAEVRVILLMDCWNPHLSAEERAAITRLVEHISDFENVF